MISARKIVAALSTCFCASAALADQDAMRTAFNDYCLHFQPNMIGAATALQRDGWDGIAGADLGEYEFHKGSISVFLATSETGSQPGCTVMDESTTAARAAEILAQVLSTFPAESWAQVDGDYGPYWKLDVSQGYLAFVVQDDLSGAGSAISFELRQD